MGTRNIFTVATAVLICLAAVAPASAADLTLADPFVPSIGDEARLDIPKEPSALEAMSAEAFSVSGVPVAPFVDAEPDPVETVFDLSSEVSPLAVTTRGNSLPITGFRDGDLIMGFNAWSVGHVGIMDATRGISLFTSCVWSAVKEQPGCVTLEKPIKYRAYDWAYGLYVPKALLTQRSAARRFCSSQIGERYNLFSAKTDYTQWYCSKLPWAGYYTSARKDLDANGGYWVAPVDIYNDGDTKVFAASH